jgi:hypothetical protein
MARAKPIPVDHFGKVIEIDDHFFNGNPVRDGIVCGIKGKKIEIRFKQYTKWSFMTIKDPSQGVCLNKLKPELQRYIEIRNYCLNKLENPDETT